MMSGLFALALVLASNLHAQTGAAPSVIPGGQAPGYTPPPLRPAATPFVPGPAGGVPQITPGQLPIDTVTPPKVDEDAESEKQEQMQQMMNSLGQMMGGERLVYVLGIFVSIPKLQSM